MAHVIQSASDCDGVPVAAPRCDTPSMRSGIALGLALGLALGGCGFHSPRGTPSDDSGGGPSIDACASFASLLDTCALTFDADLMVTGASSYDTDSNTLVIAGTATPWAHKTMVIGPDTVEVIAARNVQLAISATLTATGSHALVIVAQDTITVAADAQIDVSKGGAGAQGVCANPAMPGQDSTGGNRGGAGGGGGGFGASGGKGGDGNRDSTHTQGGALGGAVDAFPEGLHGGCGGAKGGDGDAPGGAGGKGGGALYLAAAVRIQLDSTGPINAGGGGGQGGQHVPGDGDGGGGGGGSGGLLILEAPHIIGPGATVAANGGGGGEGSDNNNPGANGAVGSMTTSHASGGMGQSTTGADGGRGGSIGSGPGESVIDLLDGGGGGGGGGVGFVRILSSDNQIGTISPDPS